MLRHAPLMMLALTTLLACERDQPAPAPPPAATPSGDATASAQAADGDADLRYARALTERFGGSLKEALMKGMSAGGPAKAVEVCSEQAPAIAKSLDVEAGWTIRRTSLKLRNPSNAPDEWERGVLERFEKKRAAGSKPDELEEHIIVEADGKKTFRYMKAIGTAALCLNCHGSQIGKDVLEVLDERYPKDEARGFAAGDIRGAFSVSRTL